MLVERWSDESRNKQMTVFLLSVYCLCNACGRLKGGSRVIEISLFPGVTVLVHEDAILSS